MAPARGRPSKPIDEKPRSLFDQQLGLVCQSLIISPCMSLSIVRIP